MHVCVCVCACDVCVCVCVCVRVCVRVMCEAHLSPAGGSMERLPAIAVLQVHAPAALQQQLRRLDVAVSRRDVELTGEELGSVLLGLTC